MNVLLVRSRIQIVNYGNDIAPLNLGYIGSALIRAGHQVTILDRPTQQIEEDEFVRILCSSVPDVVGLSCMTPEMYAASQDIKLIKRILPKTKIIMGGPHASALPVRTLVENPDLDVVIIGEGEKTVVELLEAWETEKALQDVNGIALRENDEIIVSSSRELITNLDDIAFPAYDLLPMEAYSYTQQGWEGRRFMTIISSRGCPYLCTFCSHAVFGRKIRLRSAENVLAEIGVLYKDFNVRAVAFVDDTFTVDKKRLDKICAGLKEKFPDLIWSCNATVHTINLEMLRMMKDAGCRKISFGVESGDPLVLKQIKKPITLEQVKAAFKSARMVGIATLAFFMIGLPGETRASIKETIKLARLINPDFVFVTVLCPLPGSSIFEQYQSVLPGDWKRYQLTPFNELPVLQLGELTVEELTAQLKRFYRSFYYRPSYIWSRLKTVRSPADLALYVRKMLAVSKYWR